MIRIDARNDHSMDTVVSPFAMINTIIPMMHTTIIPIRSTSYLSDATSDGVGLQYIHDYLDSVPQCSLLLRTEGPCLFHGLDRAVVCS